MSQIWLPPDIAEICPDQIAPLTQCSQLGFMYLTLLTQLFGKSIDSVQTNPYFSEVHSGFTGSQDVETSIAGPTRILGPTQIPQLQLYNQQVSSQPQISGHTVSPLSISSLEHFRSFGPTYDHSQGPFGAGKSGLQSGNIGIQSQQLGFQVQPTFQNQEQPGFKNEQSGFHRPFSYSSNVINTYSGSQAPFIQYETQIPLGPVPIKPHSPQFATGLGPVLQTDFSIKHGEKIHSHSQKVTRFPDGSFYSQQEFGKPGQSKLVKAYQRPSDLKYENSFDSYPVFNFDNIKRSFQDIDAAATESKVVEEKKPLTKVKKEAKKKRKKRQAIEEYDFIVVGAGSAGCVVASRLSEVKHWKVLLLEAGPEEPDVTSVPGLAPVLGGSSIDWNYRTQPEEMTCRAQRGQTCAWFRGKTMGGSSAINYMVYMRGNRRDYDGWTELGNPGWSYREVLPYFKKSENNRDFESRDKHYHSTGGPLNVERYPHTDISTMMIVQAFTEKGLPVTDFNGDNQLGTDIAQSTSLNGRRFSTNTAYIRPIRHVRPNLKIITNAFATKIMIDPITKTAFGVQYVKDGLYHQALGRKEVIVSAGALNSPKLLLLSGIGPKHELETLNIPVLSDLSVGHNLHDHITTSGLILGLSNKTSTLMQGQQLLDEIYHYKSQHEKKTGPLSASGTLSGTAFIKTLYAQEDAPDIQFHFDGINVNEFYSDPTTSIATNIFPLSFYDGLVVRPLLLVPRSRGFILLNTTDPVFGPPLIYSRFFTEREDLDVLIAGLKFAISLEETEAFRLSGAQFIKVPVQACANYHWGTDEYLKCLLIQYTSTIYHPVGTCKMGPKWEKDAVVDPRLRVYGIKNLRVIDASIMPKIIRGNTNAPTIMIAEKATDYIKEECLN